jgi:tricorn protease
MVLRKDLPSPLAPQSDDENAETDKAEKKDGQKDKADKAKDTAKGQSKDQSKDQKKENSPPDVHIDFENISQRILAVPLPEKNYYAVTPGKEGVIYVQERPHWRRSAR